VSNASLKEGNCVAALWLSRFSQGGGVQTLAERRVAQVTGCVAKTCSLFHSLLIKQALDLSLQPRNSTLTTASPVLKGLRVLKRFWRMADSDHLRAKSRHSDERESRRALRLNRGSRDCYLIERRWSRNLACLLALYLPALHNAPWQ
jgi:hypothetical protein